MLSHEDNDILAHVGPGTMMGDVFRQYWLPILLSSELPERGGRALRQRILGEDMQASRSVDGRVSLGPYQCRERRGVIWVYMGPLSEPPELPALEWNLIPEEQRYISKRYESCNWAQALEGGIDSSHSSFLHSRLNPEDYEGEYRRGLLVKTADKHPRFEVVDTEYGELVAARRTADEAHYYWRITQFLMPAYTMLPPYGTNPMSSHFWLPIDDFTSMAWTVTWHPTRPLTPDELENMRVGWGLHVGLDKLGKGDPNRPGSEWQPIATAENDYLIDWEAQKREVFSGLPWVAIQDQALQESMGPIYDRTQEHLGVSDTGIIQVRRRWLQAAQELRHHGVTPPGALQPEAYHVRAVAVILPKEEVWVEATAEHRRAYDGVYLPSA